MEELPKIECSTACYPDKHGQSSLTEYHYKLRNYIKERRDIWLELQKYNLEKILVVGRVLIISFPQLEICGQVAVVLKVCMCKNDGSYSSEQKPLHSFEFLDF